MGVVLDYTTQLLRALTQIHLKQFVHRDLKPQNILVGELGSGENSSGRQVVIADFGLSRSMSVPPREMTKEIQSLWYRAPEVIMGNLNYTSAVDLWSIGLIIQEMLTGKI